MTCGCNSGYNTKTEEAGKCNDCGCGCGGLKKSDRTKAKISFQQALLFFFIASPVLYGLTGKLLGGAWGECPSGAGVVLHAFVFGIVVYMLMQLSLPSPYTEASKKLKTRVAFQQAILFMLIANPAMFSLVGKIVGSWASSPAGCPTGLGLLLHSVVFGLADFGLMKLTL
jgi:hypothetical protein